MITVHAREALFVKSSVISLQIREELIEKYKFRFYEEKACDQCEFREDRHSDVCDNCAAFKGGADLGVPVTMGSTKYIKTPIGDAKGLKAVLDKHNIEFKFKKHFPNTEMKRRIEFTGTLKDHQPPAVSAIINKKRGVLRSPPRSGKTVMGAAAICTINGKTMIMASQREWLNGFLETFIGSDTQKALTTCKSTQIGFANTYEEFLKYDICLVTTQTFWSPKGQKLLKRVRDMFRCLFVDECFPAGTLVKTDKGLVAIDEIASDFHNYKALSYNHAEGQWEYKQVTNAFPKKTRKKLLRINFGDTSITCTEDHKIWSEDRQAYVKACELRPGERLKRSE